MGLLAPPVELLVKIEYQDKWVEITLPTHIDSEEHQAYYSYYGYILRGLLSSIEEHFLLGFDQRILNSQLIGMAIWETIKNGVKHGNRFDPKKIIKLGIWYGKVGIIFCCQDEGLFYSLKETKEKIEKRESIPTSKVDEECCGFGMNSIYECDEIRVDIQQNTIFLLFSHSLVRLRPPKK